MTDRKISYALTKIRDCKENGYHLEALIRSYHLNVNIIRFILSVVSPEQDLKNKKVKILLKHFLDEMLRHPELKSIINKKSLKSLKPWLSKMDDFFRAIRVKLPSNIAVLQEENDQIFAILKISANKIIIRNAA